MSEINTENQNEQNRLKLARMALENDNGAEAIKYSTEVLEMNPDNAEAWMIKGTASAYVAKGGDVELRYKESMSCLDKAKELDPTMSEVEVRRGEVKKLVSNFLCSLGSTNWDSAVKIANIYAKTGRGGYNKAGDLPNQSIQYYERALLVDENNQNALRSIIHIHKELGKIHLVQPYIERLKTLDPSYNAPKNRAQTAETLGNFNEGMDNITSILVLSNISF